MPAMNVSLTPELHKIIQTKVESGLYNNASEVVREAIRQMDSNQELLHELKLARLKEALADGLEQIDKGETRPYSPKDLRSDLKAGHGATSSAKAKGRAETA